MSVWVCLLVGVCVRAHVCARAHARAHAGLPLRALAQPAGGTAAKVAKVARGIKGGRLHVLSPAWEAPTKNGAKRPAHAPTRSDDDGKRARA